MDKQQESVHAVYYGSDGAKTRSLLRRLESLGLIGQIAAQLFRTQKYSSRAKTYRGGIRHSSGERTSYKELAYDGKEKALQGLCSVLSKIGHELIWGWKEDPVQKHAKFVLYVNLPQGQVSFHSPIRLDGPDYPKEWDGERGSERRIIEFCQRLLEHPEATESESKFRCTNEALESPQIRRTIE
jgi:hypothetical protein